MAAKKNILTGLKFGTNFAVFVIFFGIATLEAFREGNMFWIIFWVTMGLIFLFVDKKNK